MNKFQFFRLSTVLLLLLNFGLVIFFFISAPKDSRDPHQDRGMPPHEYFEMSAEQQEAFMKMLDMHHKDMDRLHDLQADAVRPFLIGVVDRSSAVSLDSVMVDVATLQREKLTLLYDHFEDLKESLTPEQKLKFESFFLETLDRTDKHRKKKGKGKH